MLIGAPLELVYELFMDNTQLSTWAPPVNKVVHEEIGEPSGVGTTRTCDVTMQGRNGTMVEQCVEAVTNQRASFLVVNDSFGFQRMFRDYGFTVHFSALGGRTRVRMETFYSPAHLVSSLMNTVLMRRKFGAVVQGLLDGLQRVAEAQRPHVHP